ncbi:hypothetical protein QBC43DRAFT_57807 [Cladorrhinum sp. PSN259]|nr:hypothetical protein QBC43DRAFT_57807 [Cladorrhinum sp. PSN259]
MSAPYSSIDSAVPRPSSGVNTPQRMPSTRSRAQSISSDRPSTVAHSLMSPPLQVSPEPAFIAASAGSQIVTNDYDNHTETWYDQHGIEPSGEPTTVSPGALQLVNSFLDQLLFNFLCVSRSTSLSALRPAVSEVLKPKLAKDAINQADEELREYLGGDDEDQSSADPASPADWDVELVWKRTRLRCMVYSSLGDMEEEDEDFYTEEGLLHTGTGDRVSEAVSPAVAIFLTSILEFMGEQALIVAGQAAYHRMRAKYEKELKDGIRSPTSIADKIVVEDLDMERVALDRTLGRLWRSWKKKIRSPGAGSMERLIRSFSDSSMRSPGHLRSSSSVAELMVPATVREPDVEELSAHGKDPQEETLEEYLIAAAIPLPLRENDVDEIEVPGLAPEINDDEDDEKAEVKKEAKPARPKSMIAWPLSDTHGRLTSDPVQPQAFVFPARKRSNSLPIPRATPVLLALNPVAESKDVSPSEETPDDSGDIATETTTTRTTTETETTPEVAIKARPQSYLKYDDEDDDVLIEEPRIVRSSRVSILGGRGPSPTLAEHGRPSAIITNLPARPQSIHSARLIEVSSPRSPVVGSQRSSLITSSESSRHVSPSRASGSASPTLADERQRRSPDHAAGSRLAVVRAPRSGLANGTSISDEVEGDNNDYSVSPITPLTPASTGTSLSVIPESGSAEQHLSIDHGYGSDVGSGTERASTPQSQIQPAAKATVLASTTSSSPSRPSTAISGTFFIESMPVLAEEGKPAQEKQWTKPQPARLTPPPSQLSQPPAVPERSAERSSGRQTLANTSAQRQPATIGQVSVERSRTGSPSDGYSIRTLETGRQSRASGSPASSKVKPVRTSEDGGMQARIDVVRNFEELIQSDQTIQYTLTPESMRDTASSRSKSSGSPVISVKHRKSDDVWRNAGPHSRSSSLARPNEIVASSGSSQRKNGHSSSASDANASLRSYPTNTSKHGGVIPRSSPPAPSRPRGNAPQARDARLPRESIAEFADFIRSTGPPGAVAPAPSIASGAPSSMRNPGMMSMTSVVSQGSLSSNPNRPRLQARDAVVDHKDGNSDLIDFIRRGPPDTQAGHRIPRAVAPFRTTMDSDQMSGAVGGKAIDAQLNEVEMRSSQASSNSVQPSLQSSANSHSALINKNKAPPSYGAGAGGRGGDDIFGGPPGGDMDMPMPKRKTRRVRDPYAIDLSDEDEMLEEEPAAVAPKPKRRAPQEESLIDFLNNYPPPPEEPVQPIYNVQVQSAGRNKPKKKSSSASLMARLTRRDTSEKVPSAGPPPSSSSGSNGYKHQPIMASSESRNLNSRASSRTAGPKYTPIQVNTVALNPAALGGAGGGKAAAMMGGGPGVGGPMMSGKAAAMMGGGVGSGGMGGSRPPTGASGRVPMKKFEPRDAVLVPSRGTSDLADFLKHSAPPPGATLAAPFPEPRGGPVGGGSGKESSGGLGKVFGRRKKQSVG